MAPQNIPRAIVLTLGNKVVLYCIVGLSELFSDKSYKDVGLNTVAVETVQGLSL